MSIPFRLPVPAGLLLSIVAVVAGSRIAYGQAGVYVDTDGVLRMKLVREGAASKSRAARGRSGRAARHEGKSLRLRKVSLVRLGRALKETVAAGDEPPEEMRYLAGLQSVQRLFVYPDEGDLVIAGPAEEWTRDAAGRAVGETTGRPVVLLDDLLTALRALRLGSGTTVVGCSIDPTQEGLARLQRFVGTLKGFHRDRRSIERLLEKIRAALGMHDIRVMGIPATTHMALVMVEADHRMKRIGLELEPRPVPRFVTYFDFAIRTGAGAANIFNRWWFMPGYEAILASTEGNAYELRGQRLRLATEMEYLEASGRRRPTGRTDKASRLYAEHFTERYAEIAAAVPVYAELENAVDLLVLAALIRREHLAELVGWEMTDLLEPAVHAVEELPAPTKVDASVNCRLERRSLVVTVGGGVVINTVRLLRTASKQVDEGGEPAKRRAEAYRSPPEDGKWWWD